MAAKRRRVASPERFFGPQHCTKEFESLMRNVTQRNLETT